MSSLASKPESPNTFPNTTTDRHTISRQLLCGSDVGAKEERRLGWPGPRRKLGEGSRKREAAFVEFLELTPGLR